jgi:hypothetical protein
LNVWNAPGNLLEGIEFLSSTLRNEFTYALFSDLLLRHRQKIHAREKQTKAGRRPASASRSNSMSAVELLNREKTGASPKRRRGSISVAPYPQRKPSVSVPASSQTHKVGMYKSTGSTSSNTYFSFAYPSPSSASPASSTDLLDCSLNSNYVNPADLFSTSGSAAGPQALSTPASTTSTSSIIPLTPEFQSYMPPVSGSSKDYSTIARTCSLDSAASFFDFSLLPPIPETQNYAGISADPFAIMENMYSPPQGTMHHSPDVDSVLHSSHSNTPFQFAWQPTCQSHGSNEYNTGLPFEPTHSSVSPIDIIMKQDSKIDPTHTFTASTIQNAQLFAFPDVNVFDLLIAEDKTTDVTKDIIDGTIRAKLVAAVQSVGTSLVEMPSAADLSEYVDAYWANIHPHMPIFFKPAFTASVIPEGILLAMCALGALTLKIEFDAVRIIAYAEMVVQQRRKCGYCALSDVQALLLLELFELYRRKDPNDDPSRGLAALVNAARNAGLCNEISNDFDDLSFGPDAEWRAWGQNEERRRYASQTSILTLEPCLQSTSSRRCYTRLQ